MRNNWLIALALLAGTACSDGPTSPEARRPSGGGTPRFSATPSTTNEVVPFAIDVFVPCANGGVGEVVSASGRLHFLFVIVFNGAGGATFKSHSQPQGVSGVGQTTGVKYQGTGVTQDITSFGADFPITQTFINNFRFIGQGPGNNYLVHSTTHVTVNANGQITAEVNNVSVECR